MILRKHRVYVKLAGILSLIMTNVLWGTSFVFIKLSMNEINPFTYTFMRTLVATLAISPITIFKLMRRRLHITSLTRGLLVGFAYSTGLCLQAAGTAYIDPSTSAFITGLSTIHVHLYSAIANRKYTKFDLLSLLIAILGLFVLTSPAGGLGVGDLLVFSATFAWAAQVILISKHGKSSMIEFLTGTFAAGLFFAPLSLFSGININTSTLLYLLYLGIVCSIGATFFQVFGQRYISASTAALLFLLEPVLATFFSIIMGLEELSIHKVIGGGLILLSLYLATVIELRKDKSTSEF
ncbi:MAG: DMT family transporter [Desulfurococcaceae archaeon]